MFQIFFITAGRPKFGLTMTILGGITNIVLDYLFLAILDFGIEGAAIATGISSLIKKILAPVLTVIGVAAVLYAIYLGVMYAKAESADKRKEVQGRLIGACIGAVIIVVGATLCFSLDWSTIFTNFSGVTLGS